jgi:AcrR family transcriptional regulator
MYTGAMVTRRKPVARRAAPVESVRPRILQGAATAFGKRGYSATSVEAILSEAGVSRRTFYKEFRNKDEVLRELFGGAVQLLLSRVREASTAVEHEPTDAAGRRARLEASIDAYLAVHERAGGLARVLLAEQFSPGSPLARQRDAAMEAFAALVSKGIERAGGVAPDPILVRGAVAAVNHIAVQMAAESDNGTWDVERAKRAMLKILHALED